MRAPAPSREGGGIKIRNGIERASLVVESDKDRGAHQLANEGMGARVLMAWRGAAAGDGS